MNPFCLMECNMKSPVQWEWDNLISFCPSTNEIPRKLRQLEWEIDGFDSISRCSSGFAGVGSGNGGGLGSDTGHTFSRSSKSTSISSSSTDVRTCNFTSEAGEGLPEDLCSSEEFVRGIGTPPSLEASLSSGEPILGLKLGKRTYFEDVCAGNNLKGLTLPVSLTSSASPIKRSKSVCQSLQAPRCQVEGCNLDLSSAKDYHRKHRVCESHSKCPIVIISGLERRFCQQCSRFHGLCEFDEKKRSCRRRLSDHNARRRKPQPEPVQLNPGLTYDADGKQQMNLVWNKFSLIHARSEDKFLWEAMPSSKSTTPRESVSKPAKIESFDGQMLSSSNKVLSSTIMQNGVSGFLFPKTKTATAELFSKDIEEVTISSRMGGSQDLDGALSLLSNATSWVPFEPRRVSLDHHPMSNLETGVHHPMTHQLNSSSDYWQTDQPVFEPTASHRDVGSQFQLFRGQCNDNYFCPNQFN